MANHAALIRADNDGLSVARRGRRFIEFALPDGKRRHVATIDPLHKRDGETEIDATWYPDTGAWQWKIGENDWQAHARSVFNVGSLIEWRHESGEWVVVDPQSINWINQDNSRQQIAIKQAVTGTASDATLTFTNAYGSGRHFEYIAHPKRLIKHFILDQALPAPESWLTGTIWFEVEWTITNSSGVELYLDGVRWARANNVRVRTANAIEFRNASGDVLWTADAPSATDANGETVAAQYEVQRQGGTYFIRVRVPREWLLAAAYPVVVDPTFVDGYGGDATTYKDTWLSSEIQTQNAVTSEYFAVGERSSADNIYRGLIQFDLSSIAASATVTSATLSLYAQLDLASNSSNFLVYRMVRAWTEAGATWNTYDGSNNWGTAGASNTTTDREASSIGTRAFDAAETLNQYKDWSLTTSAVEDWIDGTLTNNGLLLKSDNETDDAYLFVSSDGTAAQRPKLVVEYTEAGYTLTQDAAGAYALTGQAAGLTAARVLSLDAGSYELSGQAAGILAARVLATDAGEYVTTGQDPTLTVARLLGLDAGAYTLTGADPTTLVARLLAADAGEYALTGNDPALLAARLLTLEAGGYTLTGQDATLIYTPVGAYSLTLDPGSYALTGHDVGLLVSRVLSADAGVYALTGAAADVLRGFALAAEAGSYAVTGNAAGLALARVLGLDAGSYALTGSAVTLVYSGGVTPTPDSRIYVVAADGRVYVVALEERVHSIAAESRTHTVTAA